MTRYMGLIQLALIVTFIALCMVGLSIGGFNGAYLAAVVALMLFAWTVDRDT